MSSDQPAQVVAFSVGGANGSPICSLYSEGHQAHWIQLRKARKHPPLPLTFVALRGRCIRTTGPDGQPMNFCNHDPLRLARAVEKADGRDIRLYGYSVLTIGSEVFCVNRGSRLNRPCQSPDDVGAAGVTTIVL